MQTILQEIYTFLTTAANKDLLESLAYCVTILGVPLAIFLFLRDARLQRRSRELATYDDLAGEYRAFMKMCLEHPEWSIYQRNDHETFTGTAANKLVAFEMLVSMLESAFFQYRFHARRFRKSQWTGWEEYTRAWCRRKDFQTAWAIIGQNFDSEFMEHISGLLEKNGYKQPPPSAPNVAATAPGGSPSGPNGAGQIGPNTSQTPQPGPVNPGGS